MIRILFVRWASFLFIRRMGNRSISDVHVTPRTCSPIMNYSIERSHVHQSLKLQYQSSLGASNVIWLTFQWWNVILLATSGNWGKLWLSHFLRRENIYFFIGSPPRRLCKYSTFAKGVPTISFASHPTLGASAPKDPIYFHINQNINLESRCPHRSIFHNKFHFVPTRTTAPS